MFVYGSQSTGLCIESSDVDLIVGTDFECSYMMKILENNNSFVLSV
jgi:DNA polymerase sigma